MRGVITDEIKKKAEEVLEVYDFSQTELRLLPYINHVMLNDRKIDPNKVSPQERAVLSEWRSFGWIEGGASGLYVTKKFWDGIQQILWLGYVNYDGDGEFVND